MTQGDSRTNQGMPHRQDMQGNQQLLRRGESLTTIEVTGESGVQALQ